MVELPQIALWCACGRGKLNRRGICSVCDRRIRLSRENFGGLREQVLLRDGERCQACGELDSILVHHRRPGRNLARFMLALCRRCHVRIHHTRRPGFGWSESLRDLWRELHPELAEQLRLPLEVPGGALGREVIVQPELFEAA